MKIRSVEDVTPAAARALRENAKLPQTAFWERVGVAQSVGCRYERRNGDLPLTVRMLLVAVYVDKLPVRAA